MNRYCEKIIILIILALIVSCYQRPIIPTPPAPCPPKAIKVPINTRTGILIIEIPKGGIDEMINDKELQKYLEDLIKRNKWKRSIVNPGYGHK